MTSESASPSARAGRQRLSVLWLCGPPGAGKSAVGWALYVAGCDAVIVSGDVGPSPGISSGTVLGAALTICRLRASPAELRRRLASRREGPDFVAAALCQAEELDRASFADAYADTDGLTVAEVARLVRERCRGWPPERAAGAAADEAAPPPERVAGAGAGEAGPAPAAGADGDVLLVCGATGVGKSAAGFDVFLRQLRDAGAAAYIDLDQIGFMSPVPADDPGGHRLKARNLADLWRAYHAAGARRLVLTGPVPDERAAAGYAGALPAARVTVCRLHAGPAELARRISHRGQGLSWPQPGDPLIAQPEAQLRLVAAQSAAEAAALERSGLGDLRIDTDGETAAGVAGLVARRVGWGS
jgi:hypothetical protein